MLVAACVIPLPLRILSIVFRDAREHRHSQENFPWTEVSENAVAGTHGMLAASSMLPLDNLSASLLIVWDQNSAILEGHFVGASIITSL